MSRDDRWSGGRTDRFVVAVRPRDAEPVPTSAVGSHVVLGHRAACLDESLGLLEEIAHAFPNVVRDL